MLGSVVGLLQDMHFIYCSITILVSTDQDNVLNQYNHLRRICTFFSDRYMKDLCAAIYFMLVICHDVSPRHIFYCLIMLN